MRNNHDRRHLLRGSSRPERGGEDRQSRALALSLQDECAGQMLLGALEHCLAHQSTALDRELVCGLLNSAADVPFTGPPWMIRALWQAIEGFRRFGPVTPLTRPATR
jgi:hypothetical protein